MALALVLVLSLVAACDDDGDGGRDEPSSVRAAGSDLTVTTFFPTVSSAMADAETTRVRMTSSSAQGTLKVLGAQRSSEQASGRRMQVDTALDGSLVASVRVVGRTAYVRNQNTDGRFVRLDLDHLSDRDTQLFGNLADERTLTEQFAEFQSAVTSVKRRGDLDTSLDGVDAEAYTIRVDVDRLKAGAGLAGQGITEVAYEFWLGPDRLPRRMQLELSGSRLVADYSDWGRPVVVEAPPSAEVVEADEVG